MMANTNKMCINPPALYAKKPTSHPIIRITAITYNILRIKNDLYY